MSGPGFAKDFRDLVVYQRAMAVAKDVYRLSQTFPREEQYSLTSQLRRAASAIGACIAESWAKRRYPRHFSSKLTDADGERCESEHWVDLARSQEFLTKDAHHALRLTLYEIGRMLNGMIVKAEGFSLGSASYVKEPEAEYGWEVSDPAHEDE